MTGRQVYETALSFLFEKPGIDKAFRDNALSIINVLIAESTPYQNSMQRARGEPETYNFYIDTLDDAIPMDDAITRTALPFGLASFYYQDETDNFKAQDFRGRFISALEDTKKYAFNDIEDVYGGGE